MWKPEFGERLIESSRTIMKRGRDGGTIREDNGKSGYDESMIHICMKCHSNAH